MKSILRHVVRPTPCPRCNPYIPLHHGFATTASRPFQGTRSLLAKEKNDQKKSYRVFKSMVTAEYQKVLESMGDWPEAAATVRNFGIHNKQAYNDEIGLFRKAINQSIVIATNGNVTRSGNPLFWTLRNAFIRGDVKGLNKEITYSFQSFMMRTRLSEALTKKQKELADFRYPMEWFPGTRTLQRTIHLHIGPTNSGKTYHALKALENAKSGIYGGPLRLLAQEIYSRFRAKGKPCAMVTGEEQRIPEDVDNFFTSCTVEMTPLNKVVDVAVLDEIQMIGDPERGWAWTQAFMGVMAKEVHLCGEERVEDLIRSICSALGDKLIVHRYKRLSPLKVMDSSLDGKFEALEKGDAIIAFSRINLHGLKNTIEERTGRRCAIVYGSLPPETRAQQAALFNDPDNDYDFLVASDAIGMGLNLEVKRIIFETAFKFDGTNFRGLSAPEIKQIGGRAGRFRSARQEGEQGTEVSKQVKKLGLVTTLDSSDLEMVRDAFDTTVEPMEAAYLSPPSFIIERFAECLPPDTPFAFILLRIRELAKLSPHFLVHIPQEVLQVANVIQEYPLTIHERITLMNGPITLRVLGMEDMARGMARRLAEKKGGALCDFEEIDLELLDATAKDFDSGRTYLAHVEALHQSISLYLWMSYRFPSIFTSQSLAFHVRDLTQQKIEEHLAASAHFNTDAAQALREKRRLEATRRLDKQHRILDDQVETATKLANVVAAEGPGRWAEPGHQEPLAQDEQEFQQVDETPNESVQSRFEDSSASGTT